MLHNESLKIKPLERFNKSVLDALDKTFNSLDQNVDKDLEKVNSDIASMTETTRTTTNDVLTYLAFTMFLFSMCILIYLGCRSHHQHFSCTVHSPGGASVANPEQTALENLPTCKDCNRPRCSSV